MWKEHQKLNLAKKFGTYMKALCYTRVSFGTLVLRLHSYSWDKKYNTDFSQITCLKECKTMTVEKNLWVMICFLSFSKKLVEYFGLSESSLDFQWRED